MPTPKPHRVEVHLDKIRTIAYSSLAIYRMNTLDHPFDLVEIGDTKRQYAALLSWAWACAVDAPDLKSPEQLVDHIPAEDSDRLIEVWTALKESIDAYRGLPKKDQAVQAKTAES